MLKHINKLLLTILLLAGSQILYAQDPHFTQWHANYSYLNPAITGISINPHAGLNYRNQWPSISGGGFLTTALSYDQRISPKAGFIGAYLMNDMAGDAQLITNSYGIQYAYEFDIKSDLKLRLGAGIGLFERRLDFSKLHFGDQIDPREGFIKETQEKLPARSGIGSTGMIPDFGTGFILHNNKFFGGLAIHHILRPKQSFFGNNTSRLPSRYSANFGAFLPLLKDDEKSIVFSPYIVVQSQAKFMEVVPGLNVNKGIFTGGISYRQTDPNADAINFITGISKGRFKVGYSYDYTVSDARTAAKGSHELSFSFYFSKPREGSEEGLPYYFRKMGF